MELWDRQNKSYVSHCANHESDETMAEPANSGRHPFHWVESLEPTSPGNTSELATVF